MALSLLTDQQFEENMRWVQLAINEDDPVSITLVTWFDDMKPGILRGQVLLSDDIESDRANLLVNDVPTTEIEETPWGKFVYFTDPDGNAWALRENL